jgi:hypothetical protein
MRIFEIISANAKQSESITVETMHRKWSVNGTTTEEFLGNNVQLDESRYIPDDGTLHNKCSENLKSYIRVYKYYIIVSDRLTLAF